MTTTAYKMKAAYEAGLSLILDNGKIEFVGDYKAWNTYAELCEEQEKLNEGYVRVN